MRWHEWRGSMDGRPTLWVRHILCGRGRHVDLHKMIGADDAGCFHTHPALAVRIVLWGGYVEEIEGGARRTLRPGMVGIVRPSLSHRIESLCNGRISLSLWIRFRKSAPVRLRGDGWLDQRQDFRVPATILDRGAPAPSGHHEE